MGFQGGTKGEKGRDLGDLGRSKCGGYRVKGIKKVGKM